MGGILTTIQVLCTKWFQFKYRKSDQEPILDSEAVPDTRSEEIQPSHANTNYSISAETNASSDISRSVCKTTVLDSDTIQNTNLASENTSKIKHENPIDYKRSSSVSNQLSESDLSNRVSSEIATTIIVSNKRDGIKLIVPSVTGTTQQQPEAQVASNSLANLKASSVHDPIFVQECETKKSRVSQYSSVSQINCLGEESENGSRQQTVNALEVHDMPKIKLAPVISFVETTDSQHEAVLDLYSIQHLPVLQAGKSSEFATNLSLSVNNSCKMETLPDNSNDSRDDVNGSTVKAPKAKRKNSSPDCSNAKEGKMEINQEPIQTLGNNEAHSDDIAKYSQTLTSQTEEPTRTKLDALAESKDNFHQIKAPGQLELRTTLQKDDDAIDFDPKREQKGHKSKFHSEKIELNTNMISERVDEAVQVLPYLNIIGLEGLLLDYIEKSLNLENVDYFTAFLKSSAKQTYQKEIDEIQYLSQQLNSQLMNMFDNYICFAGKEDNQQFENLSNQALSRALSAIKLTSKEQQHLVKNVINAVYNKLKTLYGLDNDKIINSETALASHVSERLYMELKIQKEKYSGNELTQTLLRQYCEGMMDRCLDFSAKINYIHSVATSGLDFQLDIMINSTDDSYVDVEKVSDSQSYGINDDRESRADNGDEIDERQLRLNLLNKCKQIQHQVDTRKVRLTKLLRKLVDQAIAQASSVASNMEAGMDIIWEQDAKVNDIIRLHKFDVPV